MTKKKSKPDFSKLPKILEIEFYKSKDEILVNWVQKSDLDANTLRVIANQLNMVSARLIDNVLHLVETQSFEAGYESGRKDDKLEVLISRNTHSKMEH
jgi:hypothetical protein